MIRFLKNKFLNKENRKYLVILITIIIGSISVYIDNIIDSKHNGLVINKISILEKTEKNNIGVYIDGEVNNRGYIKVKKGTTLEVAINKAGGITKSADIQNIDLKRILKNQEKIIIPRIKEQIEEEVAINETVIMVNINMASKEELMELEGIGEKTAENIIEYRENNKFNAIEEIMEVKGIGESKYNRIKENICI